MANCHAWPAHSFTLHAENENPVSRSKKNATKIKILHFSTPAPLFLQRSMDQFHDDAVGKPKTNSIHSSSVLRALSVPFIAFAASRLNDRPIPKCPPSWQAG